MAYIYKKSVGDRDYYYLRVSKRQGKRIVAKDVAYLGSTLNEVRDTLAKLPTKEVRTAYHAINRFLESNIWLEKAKKLKLRQSPFLDKQLLEQVEACRLHWQNVFAKKDYQTKKEYFRQFVIDFAFNTTSIEGNTITLKQAEKLLTEELTPKNKTLREIYDIQNTERVFLGIVENPPALSPDVIVGMHTDLMKNIDLRTGYRTGDVHVVHARFASTPASYVKTDMDLLLRWCKGQKEIYPLVLSGIFHHKFEKIHPFFDGNGRVGRMLLNAILLQSGYPPLIIRKKNRAAYLEALGAADKSELTKVEPARYRKLIEFLALEMIETYWNQFL
jgi:Fic family protein